jgi:hypothetical protein
VPETLEHAAAEPIDDVVWPAWGYDEGLSRLARYVSPVALVTPGLNDASRLEREADMVRDRYERLQDEEIRYAYEPYISPRANRQQIRDPRLLKRAGVGTCLDLATTYAAMCLDANVAPLLAIGNAHAWVLLHIDAYEALVMDRPLVLAGTVPTEESGVLAIADLSTLLAAVDAGAIVAVDAVMVTDPDATFEAACEAGRRHLTPGTKLIDVAWLHDNGVPSLATPTRSPGIRPYVPGGRTDMTQYRGREVPADLLARTGMAVLHGDSGTGKTTIARALAVDEPRAAGWVLNASSRQALIDSLAQAELAQREIGAPDMSDQLREGYAYAALDRLRAADDEWVVVLDNADGSPRDLRGLLPKPNARQRLIVTTTNGREWAVAPRVDYDVPLVPLSDDAVREQLAGHDELVVATKGLPLVLEAYRAFLERDARAEASLRDAAAAHTGASVLWHALEDIDALAGLELLCAVAALLPPDRVPADLTERLGDAPAGAVEALSGRGLFQFDGSVARLHRLFGAAIRGAIESERDDLLSQAAVKVATDVEARELLDRHGDPITIRSLQQRLVKIDTGAPPALELGRALHGLAAVLELKGDAGGSAALYERAERHLQGGSVEELLLLSDCLHGRARRINQRFARDEPLLYAARDWTREAQRLQREADRPDGVGKSQALEGLLVQKTAAFAKGKDAKLAIILEAKGLLESAHELRSAFLPEDDPELLRSEFNLGGNSVELAKLERDEAIGHLNRADEIYTRVGEGRAKVYERERHPHIAACRHGLGIVNYFRALYVATTAEARTGYLRSATGHAEEALAQRQAFDGDEDLTDTQKSLALLGKIVVARSALPLRTTSTLDVRPVDAKRGPRPYFEEIGDELRDTLVFADVSPLSSAVDPVAHAEGWLGSSLLAALCARLGVAPASDGTLAERLAGLAQDTAVWATPERGLELGQYDEMAIVAAVRGLGLEDFGPPPQVEFDAVIVAGGHARDCLARTLAAVDLLQTGELVAPIVVGVTHDRDLTDPELKLLKQLDHPALQDEESVLALAFARAEAELPTALTATIDDSDDLVGATLGAFLDAGLATPCRLCIVTSRHERPATLARAIAHGPDDLAIDAVGIDPGQIDYRLAYRPAAPALMAQLYETIVAYRELVEAKVVAADDQDSRSVSAASNV